MIRKLSSDQVWIQDFGHCREPEREENQRWGL